MPNPTQTKKSNRLSFSVYLSPRLPDSGTLKDYYEVLRWHEFIELFTSLADEWLKVKFASLHPTSHDNLRDYQSIEDSKAYSIIRDNGVCKEIFQDITNNKYKTKEYDDLRFYTQGMSIWSQLFQEDTPVKGWILDEGENIPGRVIQLFSEEEIENEQGENDAPQNNFPSMAADTHSVKVRENKSKGIVINRDILDKKLLKEESIAVNKENQEFHKRLSILSDYPHLLRLTGWISDFQFKLDPEIQGYNLIKLDITELKSFIEKIEKTKKGDANYKHYKKYKRKLKLWRNFSKEIDFKTPWTYFFASKTNFSIKYLEAFEENYFNIENGFIKAKGNSYELTATQFDHKRLEAKLNLAPEDQKQEIDPAIENVLKQASDDLISSGIAIVVQKNPDNNDTAAESKQVTPTIFAINADPDSVNASIKINGKSNETANIDNYIIFGHHLDTGYRIDVREKVKGNGKFSSLCWRMADYKIDVSNHSSKSRFINLLNGYVDEPWIAESAQAGESGMLYVDEELCRWNNWSLTCPHIGSYPRDNKNHEYNDLELTNIRPFKKENGTSVGTLVPLRFGKSYEFRIRVVDICGNSAEESSDNGQIIPFDCYKRLEAANPPELHYIENIYEGNPRNKRKEGVALKIKEKYYGEDLVTFVIKTRIEGEKMVPAKSSIRSVCPPRANMSFVELHGSIDNFLKNNNDRNLIYQKAAYDNSKLNIEIFKPGVEIPFLTDPMVTSFCIRVFKDFSKKKTIDNLDKEGTIDLRWKMNDKDYISRPFHAIELKHNETEEGIKTEDNSILVKLRPGSIFKGEIESQIANSNFFSPEAKFSNSKFTNPKELLFVHAVQKPVIIDNGKTLFFAKYTLEGTIAKRTPEHPITLSFESLLYKNNRFPVSTAGEIKVIAEYDEVICDKSCERGYRVESGKVLAKTFTNIGEGFSLKTDRDEEPFKADYDHHRLLTVEDFKSLEHSFGDTKYRNVKYSIELVSRFKDYFPNESEFSVKGLVKYKVKDESGNDQLVDHMPIHNSKKPEALVIDSIVPVFSWLESKDKDKDEVVRKHETFRIYLEDDWYQNGASVKKDESGNYKLEEEEKIAVFFLENENTIPDEYEGLVSEFGKDPSTNANNDRTDGLKVEMFRLDKDEKIEDIDVTESDFMNIVVRDIENKDITASYKGKIKAAIFPVKFDLAKKKFYCDIKLNIPKEKKLYFPFLKLAVARYLKTSIKEGNKYDYRFSNIVTAPQVQVFPIRKIDKENNLQVFNDFASKNLEVYLIMERNNEAEFSKLIDEKATLNSIRSKKLNKAGGSLYSINDEEIKNVINKFKPTRMYIEEFEVYSVWDTDPIKDFKMDGDDLCYNPRNDIRKRLVFTYQIK